MRQKMHSTEEQVLQKDIWRALNRGDAAQLERYSDARFITVLEAQHQRLDHMYIALLTGIICSAFLMVVALASDPRWLWLILLCQAPWIVLFQRVQKPHTWAFIYRHLEQLPLGILLDNSHYRGIVQILTRRLATATCDELNALLPEQRKKLVELSIDMAKPRGDDDSLLADRLQGATLGFLALATLKQTGAEHFLPTMVPQRYTNLRRAIEEYQSAMKVP